MTTSNVYTLEQGIEITNLIIEGKTKEEAIEIVFNVEEDEEDDFDFDSLFNNDEEEEEVVVELTDFQKLTLELLEKAKNELQIWTSKNYKKSEGSVWVGGELEGGEYSFNYINNKRQRNMIKNANEDINLYTTDLINSGYKF